MKKINWGLIGCGDIAGKRVAPALCSADNSKLLAASRARFDKIRPFAKKFNIERCYQNYEELIQDPDINAVYLATPVYLHAEHTIKAAYEGKHVLCEKPMAINSDDCRKMINACKKNNVKLGVAYYRHFYPVIKRIKEILKNKLIGNIVVSQMNSFSLQEFIPGSPGGWFLDKKKAGGGPMMDFGCHRIEVLLNLFGNTSNTAWLKENADTNYDVEDTASLIMRFGDKEKKINGNLAVLNVSNVTFEPRDTLDIYGTKGSIHVPVLNKKVLRIITQAGELEESHPPDDNLHLPLIMDFIDAIINEREPGVTGNTGLNVQKIEDLINK